MAIIDFHAHAFPDFLAPRALEALSEGSGVFPETDGTAAGLVAHLDRCGVDAAVVLSIATTPKQVESILSWSAAIQSNRLIPFASIHPETADAAGVVAKIRESGIRGIKLHPLYQNFCVDERRMYPTYEAVAEAGLVLLLHAGYDIAYAEEDNAAPHRIARVLADFPNLKLVLAHMGGWKLTESVIENLVGKNAWIDTSYSVGYLTDEQVRFILDHHNTDQILFGSDTPWGRLEDHIAFVRRFPVTDAILEKIFSGNARALLG